MSANEQSILLKRFTLIKNLEYFIDESVYYRTHSDSFLNPRYSLYKLDEEVGKSKVS
jgi:hypothetical protein